MQFKVHRRTVYQCSLERAFKTPILSDVTKVHTGLGLMPKVTHTEGGADWGQPGSVKRIFTAASWTFKGGEASTDKILQRIENQYWKIEVGNFKTWMLGFHTFTGEWQTTALSPNQIQIDYTYTLHAGNAILFPFHWLFARLFWPKYMNQVLENIRRMIVAEEPYLYP